MCAMFLVRKAVCGLLEGLRAGDGEMLVDSGLCCPQDAALPAEEAAGPQGER